MVVDSTLESLSMPDPDSEPPIASEPPMTAAFSSPVPPLIVTSLVICESQRGGGASVRIGKTTCRP